MDINYTLGLAIAGYVFLPMLILICIFAYKASILKAVLQKNEELLALREDIDDIQKEYISCLENNLKKEGPK